MDKLSAFFSQGYPPKPTFTESSLSDLTGKVFIITGGYSGIGYQLTRIVYAKNATVYIAGRSRDVALQAIDEIKSASKSKGRLEFLPLDLSNLGSIKASADDFLAKENRLDVLWNNAGFMGKSATTAEGHENHLAINCYGTFLFTNYLHPLLVSTALPSPPSPLGGLDLDNLSYTKKKESDSMKYAISKVGVLFVAAEWARRDVSNGVVHLVANPGNLKTPLQRNMGSIERMIANTMLHPPILGAYTILFAGLSPEVKPSDSGRYVMPWGRFGSTRSDVEAEMAAGKKSASFFDVCETVASKYTVQ